MENRLGGTELWAELGPGHEESNVLLICPALPWERVATSNAWQRRRSFTGTRLVQPLASPPPTVCSGIRPRVGPVGQTFGPPAPRADKTRVAKESTCFTSVI